VWLRFSSSPCSNWSFPWYILFNAEFANCNASCHCTLLLIRSCCRFHAWNLNTSYTDAFCDYTLHSRLFETLAASLLNSLNTEFIYTRRVFYKPFNTNQILSLYLFLETVVNSLFAITGNVHDIADLNK